MRRDTNWATAVLLSIAAMFGLSQRSEGPRPSVASTATGHPKASAKTKAPGLKGNQAQTGPTHSNASDPCQRIEERLRAFYPAEDLASPVSFVYPDVCYSSKEAKGP